MDRYRGWGVETVEVKHVQAEPAGEHWRCVVTWSLSGTDKRTFRTAYWVLHDQVTTVLVMDEPAT